MAKRRLLCEQGSNSGMCRHFCDKSTIVARGNGCVGNALTRDIGQHIRTANPLLQEALRAVSRHFATMRASMRAYEVPSTAECVDLPPRHKPTRADIIGGHKELTDKAETLEFVRNA